MGEAVRDTVDESPQLPFDEAAPEPAPILASRAARAVLAGAALYYVLLFAHWTTRNHDGFGTYGFDLGIYDQGLWLLSRFHRPFITIMGRHLFGDHTSFILLPLVPVYWLLPGAKTLLWAQSLALGGAAVPLFLIGREKLRNEWLAAAIGVAYLAHPAVAWANMEQFHPDVFEVPLLLFAFWFMLRRRWVGYFVFLGLLLLVKEDVPLVTFMLGLYVAWKHDRRVGLVTCGVSLLYLATAMWWILPALNGVGSLNGWRVPFGGPGGVIKTAFLHPGDLISYLWNDSRPFYLWQLFAPFALMPLLSPEIVAIAIGPLLANWISTFWYQYHIQYHYTTLIVPVLGIATVYGIAKLRRVEWRMGAAGAVVVCSLFSGWMWGPATFARNPAPTGNPDWPGFVQVRQAISLVPDDAAVSAFYGYVTHLEHRKQIYEFPVPWHARNWGTFKQEGKRLAVADTVDYVMVPKDMSDPDSLAVLASIRPDFETIYDNGPVLLLRRKAA